MNIKVKGIILNETPVRESDKILTILTKEYGKITVSAKGARSPKSKFLSSTQLFCYCNFFLFNGRGFLTLSESELIYSFYGIRTDYEKLIAGQYALEVCDKILLKNLPPLEESTSNEILYLLLKTLKILCRDDFYLRGFNLKLMCIVFKFKVLQFSGFAPETTDCVVCNKKINHEGLIFFGINGSVCQDCVKNNKDVFMKISSTTLYVLNYILNSQIDDVFKFKVDDNILNELWRCINVFTKYHCDIYIKSGEMLSL